MVDSMNWARRVLSWMWQVQGDHCDYNSVPGGEVMIEDRKGCLTTLLDLPEDILLFLFQYLPPEDLIR